MARILVIEDNPENLELMSYLLRAFGHAVTTARDGEEGLAAARANNADLIVCDVNLPKMDGYAIVRALKADPASRTVPLLAVTALAMVGDRDKVLASGFDGYIAKPIEPTAFVHQVEEFLPASSAAPVPPPTTPATASASAKVVPPQVRARLLVVDDSAANRELTRAILEPFGYQLAIAGSVKAALALLASTQFDLILSDLHMPLETGLHLLATVKAEPRWREIPFLLISSSARGGDYKERALELGAARFLLRPMEPQQVLDEVAAWLVPKVKGG
jgi:two-component system cell cycle response regulator